MAEGCNAQRRAGETPIGALELALVEHGFLTAAKIFIVAFTGNRSAWINPILQAEAFFPGPANSEMMRKALNVVKTMRRPQWSCFHVSNSRCHCCAAIVTADERHFVQMIQDLRHDRASGAATSAQLVCEGNCATDLLAAGRSFATRCSPVHSV